MEPITFMTDEEYLYNMSVQEHLERPTLITINTADNHFGALDPREQYMILKEQLVEPASMIDFDIFALNGDLFHHKFMSNSDVVLYATMYINDVVDLCRKKNATLIILHGTLLHDASQLKLFYHYLNDPTIDIRIVEQVQFEYVKGCKVLCIPELYGMPKEYYDQFLFYSGQYDMALMHGTLQGSIYGTSDCEKHSDKAPIFDIDDFCMCRGPIISGHVHDAGCFKKHFYYCGSPYSMSFGENSSRKGFFILLYNLETGEYYMHFQEINSFRFETVNLDAMLNKDPKEVIKFIDNLKSKGIYKLRVEFMIEEPTDIEASNIQLINNYYKNNQSIKIKTADKKKKQLEQSNKQVLDKYRGYEFINDKSLSEFDILSKYINKKMGYTYTSADEIKELFEKEI